MSNKPKCPVFGCTIPRGIPHEHPAGVSVVMRDPAGPLDAFERAELDQLRRDARLLQHAEQERLQRQRHNALYAQATAMQNAYPTSGAQQNSRFNTDEQRMRNHRDAALVQIAAMTPPPPIIIQDPYVRDRKLTQALLDAGRIRRETADLGVVFDQAPAPRRSFVSTTARVAFWIVLVVTVAIWIFAGVKS